MHERFEKWENIEALLPAWNIINSNKHKLNHVNHVHVATLLSLNSTGFSTIVMSTILTDYLCSNITSQLSCLLPYSRNTLENIILWGMLLGRSTVGAMFAWLYACCYSIPILGESFLVGSRGVGCIMFPYSDLDIYNWSERLSCLLTTMINKWLAKGVVSI